jgi:hypothetical protein
LTLERKKKENPYNAAKEQDSGTESRDAASESEGFASWPKMGVKNRL